MSLTNKVDIFHDPELIEKNDTLDAVLEKLPMFADELPLVQQVINVFAREYGRSIPDCTPRNCWTPG
jgi:hypothetical protein